MLQRLFLVLLLLCCGMTAIAQPAWPTPEVEQMYLHAQQYTIDRNYTAAVITYKQAIALAPQIRILYRELGNALYLAGSYSEVQKVLEPLLANADADVETYRLLAAAQAAQKNIKRALATLEKGKAKFANAGILYHEAGKIYSDENKKQDALNAWLDGIKNDALFADNYYEAAVAYISSNKMMWAIIYAEQFLSMQHDTLHDDTLKKQLLAAYKNMFDNMVRDELPKYGETSKRIPANNFGQSVMEVYRLLTPVVSDGITTENLAMLRVRFSMEWMAHYHKQYPFSLFAYHDMLIRNGRFDAYNEWLFGKAESANEYKAWNIYHDGAMQRFLKWQQKNFYGPRGDVFYNARVYLK